MYIGHQSKNNVCRSCVNATQFALDLSAARSKCYSTYIWYSKTGASARDVS